MVISVTSFLVPGSDEGSGGPAALSISDVSRRTGIPAAGLRNWEQRYGLPRPQHSASGQRRYTEADCDLLAEVLRLRACGLSLPAAIARASADDGNSPGPSIFAGVRRQHPGLRVHVLDKTILLALTRAIEDECCARAQRPVLIGSFQRQRFYRSAAPRWTELARSSAQAVIFADFERSRLREDPVAEIAVPPDSPLRREWLLICDAPDHPACVAGWEHPGQDGCRDADRTFEVLWSVDPRVVRAAARIGAAPAAAAFPALTVPLAARLGGDPGPASADLYRASGLIERTLDYLISATRPVFSHRAPAH